MVHAYNTNFGHGGYEVDGDSDYEGESATGPTEARPDGPAPKGNFPDPIPLPGAFTT